MAQRDRADTARLSRGKAAAFDTKRDTGQGHESGKIGFSLAEENEDPGKRKNEKKKEKRTRSTVWENRGRPEKHIREIKSALSANGEATRRAIYLWDEFANFAYNIRETIPSPVAQEWEFNE